MGSVLVAPPLKVCPRAVAPQWGGGSLFGPSSRGDTLARLMATQRENGTSDGKSRLPWVWALVFGVLAVGLLGGGFALWCAPRGDASTAKSDLGLTMIGSGIALFTGFLIALVIFDAQRRIDRGLKRREEAAERENLKLTLSMTHDLRGVDLHDRDLSGLFLTEKDLRGANLRGVNLSDARIAGGSLDEADFNSADLRRAKFVLGSLDQQVGLTGADFTGADLRGARFQADIRKAVFDSADLRGADLRRTLAVHPHPDDVTQDAVEGEAAIFDGARYDGTTKWPESVNPEEVGAVLEDEHS
jgi:hypothetical protein